MKNIIFLLTVFAHSLVLVNAQQIKEELPDSSASDTTFQVVETMPQFPGGEAEMMRFIANNLNYPQRAIENGISGKVVVQFVIDEEGNVTQAIVIRGIGYGCDEEALRVVNSMPKWKPGTQKGQNVKVRYVLPLRFQLDSGKPEKKRKKRRN